MDFFKDLTVAEFTQANRRLQLQTPLGEDELLLQRMVVEEAICESFVISLDVKSVNDAIDPAKILGQNVTAVALDSDDKPRYFNGYVNRFVYKGESDRFTDYSLEVTPWWAHLKRRSDCRIFQDMTVKQVIESVFQDSGIAVFDTSGLKANYPSKTYCTQYNETDFNFVSRLMEQAGIFYFFNHENGKHTMVLADSIQAYQVCEQDKVNMITPNVSIDQTDDLLSWEHGYTLVANRYDARDFDLLKPGSIPDGNETTTLKYDLVKGFQHFAYPVGIDTNKPTDAAKPGEAPEVIKAWTKTRIEHEEASHEQVKGSGKVRSFSPGYKFTVDQHLTSSELNREYVLTRVTHTADTGEFVSNASGEAPTLYKNTFTCVPAKWVFRPALRTAKPRVYGPQTAFVTGPSGEEVFADKLGRVKVQFHWDRVGKADANTTCWLRVAQTMAGPGFGASFLPRIGHEVVVQFLEGDPDRPLITGQVYNDVAQPAYGHETTPTQCGIKTQSIGGDGFNEIRFEDKAKEEQVFLHAQKDLEIRVLNDRTELVKNDHALTIENNKTETVTGDRAETVEGQHTETIQKNHTLKVGGECVTEVAKDLSETVKGKVQKKCDTHSGEATNQYYIKGGDVILEGTKSVTIKVGSNFIAIDNTGISISTGGKLELKGMSVDQKADMAFKASGGVSAEVSGGAQTTIKGGMVMIN